MKGRKRKSAEQTQSLVGIPHSGVSLAVKGRVNIKVVVEDGF
jgi:hypothetical protein